MPWKKRLVDDATDTEVDTTELPTAQIDAAELLVKGTSDTELYHLVVSSLLASGIIYHEWSNPTISGLLTGETVDNFVGNAFEIGNGVQYSAEFRVRNSNIWTLIQPRLSLPVAATSPSRLVGGGQGYGGSEMKFVYDDGEILDANLLGSSGFGVGETVPSALAWDGTDLWMIGITRDRLIRLNRTTGVGTELGSSGFGVGEMNPTALAFDGTDLWMVGFIRDRLIRLNRTTGVGTEVGSSGFGVGEGSPTALAWDGTDLWMVGTSRDRLIRLNRTTGVGTGLGTAGFGVGETQPRALAFDGTDLWMIGNTHDRLIRLNRTTGVGTELGTEGFGVGETVPYALAWDGTDLWMVGTIRDRLIRLNRTTGVGTELGTAGFGVGENSPRALAWDGTDLWVVGTIREQLIQLAFRLAQSVNFEGVDYTTAIAQCELVASSLIQVNIEKLQRNDGDAFISISGSYKK